MIQDTSIKAYREDALPTIGQRQAAVIGCLMKMEKATNNEISRELGWQINTVTPRVHELRKMGIVTDDGKRACTVTGRLAYVWVLKVGQKPLL